MKKRIFQLCFVAMVLGGVLLPGGCSSTPYPETNEELFRALDAGITQWKQYYDNAEFARQDRLKNRLNELARDNRYYILKGLESKNVSHRIVAAKSIPFLRIDRQVLRKLNGALKDSDHRVRENAAFTLSIMRPDWDEYGQILKKIKKNILKMTRSNNVNEREMGYFGVFGLVSIRDPHGMMDILLEGLKSDSVGIRNESVRALQIIQSKKSVKPLLKNTLHDPSELVRLNTIIALYSINDRRAVPGLIDLLLKGNRENPEIIRMTVELLRRLTGMRELKTPEDWIEWYRKQRASKEQPPVKKSGKSENGNQSNTSEEPKKKSDSGKTEKEDSGTEDASEEMKNE